MQAYPAELYAAVHSGNQGDQRFYRRACADAKDVLELGCGYGRIAARLAADGKQVVGIDSNPDLLRMAALRGVSVVEADMRNFDLGREFDRVIIPFNGLYCLLSEAEWLSCFRLACAHLKPEGRLIFDGWAADAFHKESDPDAPDVYEHVVTVTALGSSWDVFERSDWDRDAQRIDAFYRHVSKEGERIIEACISQRYAMSHQYASLLERAGFKNILMYGGFEEQPLDEESDHVVVVATRTPTRVAR